MGIYGPRTVFCLALKVSLLDTPAPSLRAP